jgi:hypothetical protein
VKWKINTGYPGASHEGEWEVEDDITDDELHQMMEETVNDYIDAWWKKSSR